MLNKQWLSSVLGFFLWFAGLVVAAQTQWGPWIQTHWDQGSPQNDKCPKDLATLLNSRSVAGCVAIATSQILYYWQYPKQMTFDDRDYNFSQPTSGGDRYKSSGKHGSFFIPDSATERSYPSFSDLNTALSSIEYDGNEDELAALVFGVGVKCRMGYSASGSGANHYTAQNAYLNDFGYGEAKHFVVGASGDWNQCKAIIIDNMKKAKPVQVGIHSDPDRKLSQGGYHSIVADGYRSDDFFHLNIGWGAGSDTWYNLPQFTIWTSSTRFINYDVVDDIIYDISKYYGWSQDGYDQYNRCQTVNAVPTSSVQRVRYNRSGFNFLKGFIIGEGNWTFTTYDPTIINDSYHPKITAVNQYGTLIHNVEITDTNHTISGPIQGINGNVFFGAGDGIYKFRPRDGKVTCVYRDTGNYFFGDSRGHVDNDGYMYFGSDRTRVCLTPSGAFRWRWDVPSGGTMYSGSPVAVDPDRDNVYLGYWKEATQEAVLVCIYRSTGQENYRKTFSSITTSDRGIHSPVVGIDGTIYVSVRTKIYALTPGANSFSEKWVKDKSYARYQPIAIGSDNHLYTEYWTVNGSNYYLTLAKLDYSTGNVIWEKPMPDIGNYSSFLQPVCAGNDVVVFPVHWDSSPEKCQLYTYTNAGALLWTYTLPSTPSCSLAVATNETLNIIKPDGTIIALTDKTDLPANNEGTAANAEYNGMGYADNSPPNSPSSPQPVDGASNQPTSVTLSWTASDPDGHSLKYDIYVCPLVDGSEMTFFPIATGIAQTSYPLDSLAAGVSYQWKVISSDGQATTESPTWTFTTKSSTATLTHTFSNAGYYLISVPFSDTTIADAEALAKGIPNCTIVWYWDALTQSWSGHPKGTIIRNFAVVPGGVYLASVSGAGTFSQEGTWAPVSYAIKTGYNLVSLPNSRQSVTTAEALVQDIPNCTAVWQWNSSTQSWSGHPKGTIIRNFGVSVGQPYLISVTADDAWPATGK
ncbi:MAG: C10 family peptidase [Lentisphaeria bacterium]